MKRFFSAAFEKVVLVFYFLGFASLVVTHLYATVLAYQYVNVWKASRTLIWVMLTFLVPVLSTLYWIIVHWLQTQIFWNWLTVGVAFGMGCIAAGMLWESVRHRLSH